mmetsp:Transcript_11601/g.31063  ORF Transcript_11601/g.31063 Transcript_11601/m.31063 type:complete len:256 (-) Transcript_11601:153-920(-)
MATIALLQACSTVDERTSVDSKLCAGQVRARAAAEEDACPSSVLWRADARKCRASGDGVLARGRDCAPHHPRHERPRANGVHRNMSAAQSASEVLGEHHDGGLARRVCKSVHDRGLQPIDRRNVDHAPWVLLRTRCLEQWHNELGESENGVRVEQHHLREHVKAVLPQWRVEIGATVVYKDVEFTIVLFDGPEKLLLLFRVADVAGNGHARARALPGKLVGVARAILPRGDVNLAPVLDEARSDHCTDARAPPGH